MPSLKQIAKRVPGLRTAYKFARLKYEWLTVVGKPTEAVFTDIFRDNKWGGKDSLSGGGSDLFQTRIVRAEFPGLLREFNIRTMLDIPCGDFHWMKHVDLANVDYTGGDIVTDLIQQNVRHEASNIHFRRLNLISDPLPPMDLIFCRDCLVHLSFKEVLLALHNIVNSGSTYLLATTFTDHHQNQNIATGQWRPLNLEIPPFLFPPPLKTINEGCTEFEGSCKDKSLALWEIADIAKRLPSQPV